MRLKKGQERGKEGERKEGKVKEKKDMARRSRQKGESKERDMKK